jgi:hypothetical protein
MKTVTINEKERLYVIPEASGYTCLGFDVCQKRATLLAAELGVAPPGAKVGTLTAYEEYADLISRAEAKHKATGWRSSSELTPELVGLEGRRVEIEHEWESGSRETVRFKVGKSTGFIPCHLMLANVRSHEGFAVCLGKIIRIRTIS